MTRSHVAPVALILCLATGPIAAQATGTITMDWTTTGSTPFEVAEELATLYVSLFNTGNLTVQDVPLGSGGTVEAAMRRAGVFTGDHFPLVLDAMLCDLNADVCSRARVPVGDALLSNSGGHVGGFAASYGVWTAGPQDGVTIPSYTFETRTTLAQVPVPDGWTAQSYTPGPDVDCTAWGMTCADLVTRFNPRIVGRTKSTGVAALPVPQLATRVQLAVDAGSRLAAAMPPGTGSGAAGQSLPLAARGTDLQTPAWRDILAGTSPSDLALDRLNRNLAPIGRVFSQDGHAETVLAGAAPGDMTPLRQRPTTDALLRAINHPLATLEDMPAALRRPVGVAVIDYRVEAGHCDWPPVFVAPDRALPAATAADCAQIDETAVANGDHGVHVAGLIAGQRSAFGPIGLNPAARLYLLPFDRTLDVTQQIPALTQTLITIPPDVRVVNMSIGFLQPTEGSDALFKSLIAAYEPRSLFVIAAGNDARDLKINCNLLPACYVDMDNVMTVVGLDASEDTPELWETLTQGTNWSPRFAIGAVAENVLSTVSGNRYAHHSGTSSAAPQVAAAASLVFAAAEWHFARELDGAQIAPKMVKDRLIYTADFFPELDGRMASGRLNVSRAVDVTNDRFILRDGRQVAGQVIAAPDWFECRTSDTGEALQSWWNLRRLTVQDNGRYLIFKHEAEDRGDRFAPLRQFPSCVLTTLSPVVRVQLTDGSIVDFPFGDIRDYTSQMVDSLSAGDGP
ncbi:S8 family serine peptidase [Loktanella sp. M215]|uniref:S8 family serine peptidase n=1 Tax=Loktanella sp. M215 TaxID=2675431 RepID=UPI001F013028|nr:S8 family serine peptidase [Loktanella sp. M215]